MRAPTGSWGNARKVWQSTQAGRDRTDILQRVRTQVETVEILGVPFARLDALEAVDAAESLYESADPAWIAVENAHALNIAASDPKHLAVLRRADMVLNDGKGTLLAARLLGSSFPEDLNGNFFTPLLLRRAAERGWSVFFLGAGPGVAEQAATRLTSNEPRLNIVGTRDGFIQPGEDEAVIKEISESGADLLLIGMGMPRQEQWLDNHVSATGVRLASTVGAFFDFQAGVVPRAPGWMNRLGLEWLYRLYKEPRRLWRRYLIGNPLFVWRVLAQRLRS
jgi:exopolysaccharide biosynthesis WecB/TagA/CpsF family protein